MINNDVVSKLSWLHYIHPSLRMIVAIFYASSVALFCNFRSINLALAFSFLIILSINFEIKIVAKRILVLLWFLLLIWIVLPLTHEPGVEITLESMQLGALFALKITLKMLAISLFFMALILPMNLSTLGYSLRYICIPKKMVNLILITYRYVFLIEKEYFKIARAVRARGFKPGTNMLTYRTCSYFVGMLFVRAYDRATRIHNAMICRNFKGDFFVTKQYELNWQSLVFVFCVGVLGVVIFFLR